MEKLPPATSLPPMSESSNERVKVEFDGPVARVTLNRAEKMNALDLAMVQGLIGAAKQVKKRRDVRVVVLRGDGDAFCAGLDFASVGRDPKGMALRFLKFPYLQKMNSFQRCCWAWRELPQPVIAELHGHCYGGGMQLALAADFRFVTPDCKLSVMEAKWGLIPDMSGSVSLRELVPIDVAKRLTYTAEVFDGNGALELGLVSGVAADPAGPAEELVAELVTKSPDALALGKELFQKSWTSSERRAFWLESILQLKLLRSKNHAIARKAGAKGETPSYRDRSVR